MPKFRKKPVVIDAMQWRGDFTPLVKWVESFGGACNFGYAYGDRTLTIPTLEGDHTCSFGDWVIRGVKGEFYPVKPDIFAATYEPANENSGASAPRGDTPK